MRIGVLALQGAFREHLTVLERCGAEAVEIRQPGELEGIGGLILPGGESTTIGKLMVEWNLMETIRQRTKEGMAVYGTCAGMILLAKSIVDSDQPRLGLMDTTVRRNAFGRQVESFEEDLTVPELAGGPVRAVFIRAPLIEEVGANVAVMAQVNGKAVIARQDNMLVTSFHPELTGDDRIHRYFLSMIKQE